MAIAVEAAQNSNRAIFPLKSKAKKFDGSSVGFWPSAEKTFAGKSTCYHDPKPSSGNDFGPSEGIRNYPSARDGRNIGGQAAIVMGVEVPADQHFDVRVGSGDGAKNLAAASLRFAIANPHLQVTFGVTATPDEGGIQGDRNRRCRCFRPDRGTIPKCGTGSQGVATHGLFVFVGADREHLLQYVSRRPIGHQGGQVSLKLIQFRCRSAMRWPVDPNLNPTTHSTAKPGQPHRDLTEQRGYHMTPVILHVTSPTAAPTLLPPNGVDDGLGSDDLPLERRQQQLRFGQAQPQTGDIAEIVGLVDLYAVRALPVALSAGFHQP
jgi:hypothetical protein